MLSPKEIKRWVSEFGYITDLHNESILFHFDNDTTIRIKEQYASAFESVLLGLGYNIKWDNDEVAQVKGWNRNE